MRGLSAEGVLAVWERGHGKKPVHLALDLYSAACPEESREELALHSIGRRDRALLELREATLGGAIESVVECPSCGEKLDLAFHTADLNKDLPAPSGEISLNTAGYQLRLRAPNTLDVAVAMELPLVEAEGALLRRCLISATQEGRHVDQIPTEILEIGASRLAEADAGSEIRLNVSCAFCGHTTSVLFDIVTYFWTEIEWWATRLLGEVHEIASVYGWTEREILSLSPARRQSYLKAVRS